MHLLRREGLTAPEPASGRARRGPVFFKELQQLLHVGGAKPLVLHERQLEQAGLQVSREQQQVVRVDEAFLWIGAEEVLWVADDELVERRARRDEHADRAGPAARAPQLLPGRRDGPRIADQHRALDRKSTRLNSSHLVISYAVFCLKKKKEDHTVHHSTI